MQGPACHRDACEGRGNTEHTFAAHAPPRPLLIESDLAAEGPPVARIDDSDIHGVAIIVVVVVHGREPPSVRLIGRVALVLDEHLCATIMSQYPV